MARLIDIIIDEKMRRLSVVGLAKNTGKTVTFNTLVSEARSAGLRSALVSFGRDGEAVDAVTLLEKPRIHVPPNTLFVTAKRFINPSVIDVRSEISTGITSVFGETKICVSGPRGGKVELIGINKLTALSKVLPLLQEQSDLILIDGALDRRSSAVPVLSDGCVLSTGAVLGMYEDDVIRHTAEAVMKLKVPRLNDPELEKIAVELFSSRLHGVVLGNGEVVIAGRSEEAIEKAAKDPSAGAVVLGGALTDSRVDPLLTHRGKREMKIILKDNTRLFISRRVMDGLQKRGVGLRVIDPVNIIALTVNPTRPFCSNMDSDRLVGALRDMYPEYPCFNVLSEEYREQGSRYISD